MPFCPNCGNSISPSYSFCPNCGAKLSGDLAIDSVVMHARIRIVSTKIPNLGGNYEGDVKNGIPDGEGIVQYDNGIVYKGTWKDGKKNGAGVYTWPNGKKYEGDFQDDRFCGQGVMHFPEGCRYEGEFCNDQMNGHGIMIYSNGNRYVGGWKEDSFAGDYRFYFTDGRFFEGKDYPCKWDKPKLPCGYYSDEQGNRFFANQERNCIFIKKQSEDCIIADPFKAFFVIKWKENDSATLLRAFISRQLANEFLKGIDQYQLESDEHIDLFSASSYYASFPLYCSTVYISLRFKEVTYDCYNVHGLFEGKETHWEYDSIFLYSSKEKYEEASNGYHDWEKRGPVYYNNRFHDVVQFFTATIVDFPDF